MLTEFGNTKDYSHKFDSPMAKYLYGLMLNNDNGDADCSDGRGNWAIRYGRRILRGDDQGFVTCASYDTYQEAGYDYERIRAEHYGWTPVHICTDCYLLAANGPDAERPAINQPGLAENEWLVLSDYNDEPSFSWYHCDACCRPEGGDRYTAYVAYGQEGY